MKVESSAAPPGRRSSLSGRPSVTSPSPSLPSQSPVRSTSRDANPSTPSTPPLPPSSRHSYAHGRKIFHVRFRLDGAINSHLFFIKTKQMRLRQMMAAALHARDDKKEQEDEEKETLDPHLNLNADLQRLYREGRLGSDPYHIAAHEQLHKEEEEKKAAAVKRRRRSPRPVTAVLPTIVMDRGETEDERERDEDGDEDMEDKKPILRPSREAEVERIAQRLGIGSLTRSQPWYLYPPPCTVAGDHPTFTAVRTVDSEGGQLQRVR